MTEAQDSGDLQRAQVRNLATVATTLLERAAAAPAGRAALTSSRGGRSAQGEARSVPAVVRMCGVPPRPSFGTTVGGGRASTALISYRVGGSLQRLGIGGWSP
jgi:hypothetical protein